MRYKTTIELICDANNSDDASNIAGEYLKGDIDFGVNMRCKTESLLASRARKCTALFLTTTFVFFVLIMRMTPISVDAKISGPAKRISETYTILPALKTKHKADFKVEWEERRDEAVIEYLKK